MKQAQTLLDLNKPAKPVFLKEWTPDIFKTMERKISAHFSGRPMFTHHGSYPSMHLGWSAISDRLGLAYTSTSSYAAYWVCNTEAYNTKFPGYYYNGFAMGEDNKAYAALWDKDENEIIIPI